MERLVSVLRLRVLPANVWLGIGLAALSLGLTVLTWDRVTWWTADSFQYLRLGENLLGGRGHVTLEGTFNAFFPPVYPLALGLLDLVVHSPEASGRAVSAVGSAVSVCIVFLVARRWFAVPVALLGSVLYLGLPLRIWSSSWVMTEGLYTGLVWGAVLLALRSSPVAMLLAGCLVGLAFLARPEGSLYLLVALGLRILARPSSMTSLMRQSLLMVGAFSLVALSYWTYLYTQSGQWTIAGKLEFNLAWAHAVDEGLSLADIVRFDETALRPMLPDHAVSVADIVSRYPRNVAMELERLSYLMGPSWLTLALLAFGVLGIIGISPARQKPIHLCEQGLLILPLLVLPFLFISDRFLLSSLPVLCLWLGLGMLEMGRWCADRLGAGWWGGASAVGLATIVLTAYTARVVAVRPQSLALETQVGQTLRDYVTGGERSRVGVMTSDPAIAYFAGQDWMALPSTDLDHALRYAEKLKADYVVLRDSDPAWLQSEGLWRSSLTSFRVMPTRLSSQTTSVRILRMSTREEQ